MERVVNGYDNEVYRIGLDGGHEAFVRIRRQGEGEFDDEAWGAMERADSVGVPVPEILGIDRVLADDGERSVMVVASAPGRALETIDTLTDADRLVVMVGLGQLLKRLRTVTMPGMWRPDADGAWPTPDELRRYDSSRSATSRITSGSATPRGSPATSAISGVPSATCDRASRCGPALRECDQRCRRGRGTQ